MRALVRRPRRKMHLAHHDGVQFVTFCDLLVADDARTTVQPLEWAGGATTALVHDILATVKQHPEQVCAHCRRFILLIELLRVDRYYPRHEFDRGATVALSANSDQTDDADLSETKRGVAA